MTREASPLGNEPSLRSALDETVVLVTGGAGLVGRRLVNSLSPVADVRVLDHFQTSEPSDLPADTNVFRGDICDRHLVEQAIDGVDVVFHQAATSGPYALENPLESHEINATATLQLLECAREENVRTVLASSAAVYGPTADEPISEDAAATPLNPYGLQKLTVDEYARLYHELYGLETVVLRYFNVYGYRPTRSRRKNVVNIFIERAREGSTLQIKGDGAQIRDFVHVDDVVRANLRAAVTSHVGESFNIGTGHGTRIDRLAELVRAHTTGVSVTKSAARPTDVETSVADISKAREQLGYSPSVSVQDGVAKLWEAYSRRDTQPS